MQERKKAREGGKAERRNISASEINHSMKNQRGPPLCSDIKKMSRILFKIRKLDAHMLITCYLLSVQNQACVYVCVQASPQRSVGIAWHANAGGYYGGEERSGRREQRGAFSLYDLLEYIAIQVSADSPWIVRNNFK